MRLTLRFRLQGALVWEPVAVSHGSEVEQKCVRLLLPVPASSVRKLDCLFDCVLETFSFSIRRDVIFLSLKPLCVRRS